MQQIGYPRAVPYFVWDWLGGDMRTHDDILKSVVFVGTGSESQFSPLGTGFFVTRVTDGYVFQHLITCSHVLDAVSSEDVLLRINLKSGGSTIFSFSKSSFVRHPRHGSSGGELLDIAVAPVNVDIREYDIVCVPLDPEKMQTATSEVIEANGIGVGDEVFCVGLFLNHYGELSNAPVVRCGTIALMSAEPISTLNGFVDGFLIETHSIAGLSGSPLFLHMAPFRVVNNEVRQSERTQFLLGMVLGHFRTKQMQDVVREPGEDDRIGEFNTGIGLVAPLSKIMETVDHPELMEMRKAIAKERAKKSGFVPDYAFQSMDSPTKADNPRHEEDFNSLLDAAAKGRKSGDQS